MGDVYEAHEALADQYSAGLINADGSPVDEFDSADEFDGTAAAQPVKQDPARPEAVRGRYPLPDPTTGEARTWQRVTNFIKLAEDTYHLELWKQRNVAKGIAMRPDYVEAIQQLDVKQDKDRLNKICSRAQELAGAHKMSDEGTALHTSTEIADYAYGRMDRVPDRHRPKVRMYLDALRANGLVVADGMIERVTVSQRYEVAGKFDRVYQLLDNSYVIGDVKSGDSLDLSFPSISGQLACYEDGINNSGIWDGSRYDRNIRVRSDFGIVVHLPSTRDEVAVYKVDLHQGHVLNRLCLEVRGQRRVKAKHVAELFQADAYRPAGYDPAAVWLEEMVAARSVDQLVAVADRARRIGQWTDRLATQARLLAAELKGCEYVTGNMGS